MNISHKNHSSSPLAFQIFLLIFSLACFVGICWAIYRMDTSFLANRDFMSLYAGGTAVLEGLNPYDVDVWHPLRARLGSSWMPDPRAPFPMWTIMFFAPLALLNLPLAGAIWITLSLCFLAISVFLLSSIAKTPFSPAHFALIMLSGLLYFNSIQALAQGQFTHLLLLILVLVVYFMRQKRPFLAGCALAFIILKPNPFILFAPAIGLWLLWRKEWRMLAGAAFAFLVLLAISWAILPGWIMEWANVRQKTEVTQYTATLWGLAYELSPEWWLLVGMGLCVALTAVFGWLVFIHPHLHDTEVVLFALIVSLLTTPYTWEYELLLLFIPLVFIYSAINTHRLHTLGWVLFTIGGTWFMYWVSTQRAYPTYSVIIPFAVGGWFYWMARTKRLEKNSSLTQ